MAGFGQSMCQVPEVPSPRSAIFLDALGSYVHCLYIIVMLPPQNRLATACRFGESSPKQLGCWQGPESFYTICIYICVMVVLIISCLAGTAQTTSSWLWG